MGTQYDRSSENEPKINRIEIIGNINSKNIEINEEKGFAKYSLAVNYMDSNKEKHVNWYNLTHFFKDSDDKFLLELKGLQNEGLNKQLKVRGNISYSKVNKDGEDKHYTNLTSYSIEPTPKFILPKAEVELTGVINKEMQTKDMERANPETGEIKNTKFGYMSIKTTEGSIDKYHNVVSNYKEGIEFLANVKHGEPISIKANLGNTNDKEVSIRISKNSKVLVGKDFSNSMPTPTKKQDIAKTI